MNSSAPTIQHCLWYELYMRADFIIHNYIFNCSDDEYIVKIKYRPTPNAFLNI